MHISKVNIVIFTSLIVTKTKWYRLYKAREYTEDDQWVLVSSTLALSLSSSLYPCILKSDFSWVILHIHRFEKIKWIGIIKSWEINQFSYIVCDEKFKHFNQDWNGKKQSWIIGMCAIWKWLLAKPLSGAAASDTHHLSPVIRTEFKLP